MVRESNQTWGNIIPTCGNGSSSNSKPWQPARHPIISYLSALLCSAPLGSYLAMDWLPKSVVLPTVSDALDVSKASPVAAAAAAAAYGKPALPGVAGPAPAASTMGAAGRRATPPDDDDDDPDDPDDPEEAPPPPPT